VTEQMSAPRNGFQVVRGLSTSLGVEVRRPATNTAGNSTCRRTFRWCATCEADDCVGCVRDYRFIRTGQSARRRIIYEARGKKKKGRHLRTKKGKEALNARWNRDFVRALRPR